MSNSYKHSLDLTPTKNLIGLLQILRRLQFLHIQDRHEPGKLSRLNCEIGSPVAIPMISIIFNMCISIVSYSYSPFFQVEIFAVASFTIFTNVTTLSGTPGGGNGRFLGGAPSRNDLLSKRHSPIFPYVKTPFMV